MYFGGSIAVTAASALAAVRSPVIMNIVMKNGFLVWFVFYVSCFKTSTKEENKGGTLFS